MVLFDINKSGQIDKIISFLPVFIVVFLLIASFLVFSALISKSGSGFGGAKSVSDVELPLRFIDSTFKDKMQHWRVIDAIYTLYQSSSHTIGDRNSFSLALQSLLKNDGQCLAIIAGSASKNAALISEMYGYHSGKVQNEMFYSAMSVTGGPPTFKEGYDRFIYSSQFNIVLNGESYGVIHYQGGCSA